MSATTTTETPRSTPEITFINRVAAIPLVSSSLLTIHDTLSNNPYTKYSYTTAQGLSSSAYKFSEPIQVRLAPLIVRADSYANKAVDAVQSRYPYPFEAKPEEVAEYVHERRVSALAAANKTIEERVKTPAYHVAQGIDQRFAPIIDIIEVAVDRLNHNGENGSSSPKSPSETQFQYQRALALSNRLKDQVYVYSNEQIQHLQTQNALVHRATETAHNITALASSSLTQAQSHIHALSDTMLSELQKLQASTAASAQHLQSQTLSHIPASVRESYADVSTALSQTITDLRAVATDSNLSLQEKVTKVAGQVREGVQPALDKVRVILAGKKQEVAAAKPVENGNGHAPSG